MRVLDCLTILSFGVGLALSFPPGASAQDGEQVWQRCIGAATAPDNRVSACTSVIDAKTETGRKLAAAETIMHSLGLRSNASAEA